MIFQVRALSSGQRVRLRIEAGSAAEAESKAREDGLVVLVVKPDHGLGSLFSRCSPFPLLLFTRE